MTSLRIANELSGRENQHEAGESYSVLRTDFQLLLCVTLSVTAMAHLLEN